MDLRECYDALGGSFDEVLGRLKSERLVQKFALKFLDDKSYPLLLDALAAGDLETAFRAAHTLKGVCQNLSFTALYHSSRDLTELLRDLQPHPETDALLSKVTADYGCTIAAIRALDASLSGAAQSGVPV